MLEGLDDIDWSSLTHAYGDAGDVPGVIRARASTDAEEAKEAEFELFGNIWHQGTVYEATAPAVPFLVELAERPETHDRPGLLMLLGAIAEGTSYLEVHEELYDAAEKADAAFKARRSKELEPRWPPQTQPKDGHQNQPKVHKTTSVITGCSGGVIPRHGCGSSWAHI